MMRRPARRHIRVVSDDEQDPRPQLERRAYSTSEVAQLFGVDRTTVARIAKHDGAFAGVPAIRVSGARTVFSRVAIDRVLDGETLEQSA